MKYKKRLSAKKKQRNKLRKSGKYVSSMITQSGGTAGVAFLVGINITSEERSKITCMAIHPVHPLLAVCYNDGRNTLYRIIDSRPNPKIRSYYDPARLSPIHLNGGSMVTCFTFHPTLPLVVGINDEIGNITVWNIQELVDHIDEVPLNVKERRRELQAMLESSDATEIEKLKEELDHLEDPALNLFATTTITGQHFLSCVTFHPTMPFIVVGCTDFKSNPNLSVIKIFHIDDANITEVNKDDSIIIPIDEDPIKSIAFSNDGVFLAATFGKKVRVWIFSPTEKMEEIGNIDTKIVIKSLVFSPREPILVIGGERVIYVVGVEKGGLTVLSKHVTDFPITTLALHPTLPLLACGLVTLEIKYYVIHDDTLSELNMFKFKKDIHFDRLAFNKQFLVTCDDKILHTYTIDDVLHAGSFVLKSFKDKYTTANLSLARKDVPRDVRDLILNKTSYSNPMKSIEPYKEIVGEKTFLDFIQALSANNPPWSLELIQQFIDLLKIAPNLPPILVPFEEIVTNYVVFNADYVQTCNEIVERFITENNVDPESKIGKKIKDFFSNMVRISVTYIQDIMRRAIHMHPNYLKEMRTRNQTKLKQLFPFLQQLFILNQSAQNHRFIIDINLKEWLEYAKAERDFTIDKLEWKDPERYNRYRDSEWWNEELKELALKRDEARRRRRRESQSQGGGTRRKMRSRTYKKYSYKSYKK
jgi:WD40 repeat protein